MTARSTVAIVGGGLSGLHAAELLERGGFTDNVLIEARGTFGGRLLSVSDDPTAAVRDRFDLGATWYWPAMQPELDCLVKELGLRTFEQAFAGDLLIERRGAGGATRAQGLRSEPASMRIVGGMEALANAVARRIVTTRMLTRHRVTRLTCDASGVEIEAVDDRSRLVTLRVSQVLLALPPRLAATTIAFKPELPEQLRKAWAGTATWMAPHAKYLAVYDEPFWRAAGLSGAARSDVGPMVEVHDASAPGGAAALFGFLGVPAEARARVSQAELLDHCRAQLVRLFGDRARAPTAELVKDWAADPFTAAPADQRAAQEHAEAPASTPPASLWQHRLIGVGSEWSARFPGYVAGAIDAAERGVGAAAMAPIR